MTFRRFRVVVEFMMEDIAASKPHRAYELRQPLASLSCFSKGKFLFVDSR
jgi:hypothetical protein